MRMRLRVEPAGGLSSSMRIRSVLHDPDEVGHLLDHAARDGRVLVFYDLVELSQSEGAHRRPLPLGAADRAADELDLHRARGLSHWSGPRGGAPAMARRSSRVKQETARGLAMAPRPRLQAPRAARGQPRAARAQQ